MREFILIFGIVTILLLALFLVFEKFWLYALTMTSQLLYLASTAVIAAIRESKITFVLFVTQAIIFGIIGKTYIFKLKARKCQLRRNHVGSRYVKFL